MGHTQVQNGNVGDLPLLESHEDSDAVLDAGHLARIEPCEGRTRGYPFKRYPVAGRCNGTTGAISNGLYRDSGAVDGNRGGVQLLLKSKAFTGRSKKNDKPENVRTKGRSCICSMLFSVVICCILAEAMLQRSFLMLSDHTDLLITLSQDASANTGEADDGDTYALGYNLKFVPWKFEQRFMKKGKVSMGELRMLKQSFVRSPRLALVCFNLERTPETLYLITIAKAIQELGYHLELYTFHDGPMRAAWLDAGVALKFLYLDGFYNITVDWSSFEGIIVSSLSCKHAISSLMQEPFSGVPVIWIILEDTLGQRLRMYESLGLMHLTLDWKQAFKRADAIVFPDYSLPMIYGPLDTGNLYVIPGSPLDLWEAKQYTTSHKRDEVREKFGLQPQDIALVVVGSLFAYKEVWREHALIMRAVHPVAKDFEKVDKRNYGSFKMFFAHGNSTSGYDVALQNMALHLGLSKSMISHFGLDGDINGLLWAADIVIYCSLREEQAFPNVLIRAMAFSRLVLAPNSTIIQPHMVDRVSGLLFPAGDVEKLTHAFTETISNHRLSALAERVAYGGSLHAQRLLVADAVVGYAKLLEMVLQFPSETKLPLPVSEIPEIAKSDWQWQLMADTDGSLPWDKFSTKESLNTNSLVHELELQSNRTHGRVQLYRALDDSELLSNMEWESERSVQIMEDIERREQEEVEERQEQPRGSWEDVYRFVKRVERSKGELHERDDGELERTGQPLCIYEPYFGAGAWPFLHQRNPLYRGISLLPRERRPGFDDIEAALRLPLLKDSYYQGVLCEYGAFFAIANRVDRVHKNAWIGFQSWQAAARRVILSTEAENRLVDAARMGKNGDAVYFWALIDGNQMNNASKEGQKQHDFWSFCDAINNGNCRRVFLEAFRRMYGLPSTWTSLPPMLSDTGRWGALHCWAMHTSSFLEFVMFARIFVDALDSNHYIEHHDQGICCLGISKLEVEHCYCRLLELLVNVWAYHSAHKMIYVDPATGVMHEQHTLSTRKGRMWVRFFTSSMLKGLDEDLAEEADDAQTSRWLWPQTGEIFSPGIFERERRERNSLKMQKRRKNKERVERIRSRHRQKPLAGG